MFNRFKKDEKGSGFIVMVFAVLICLLFFELIWEVGSAYLAKEEVRHYADAAVLGGSFYATIGKTDAFQDGGKRAYIVQADAENKARQILKVNEQNKSTNKTRTLHLKNVVFNKDAVINNKAMTTTEQYYDGYFTVEVTADYIPRCLEPFKNICFYAKSRTKSVPK